jgi:hypothetical protein
MLRSRRALTRCIACRTRWTTCECAVAVGAAGWWECGFIPSSSFRSVSTFQPREGQQVSGLAPMDLTQCVLTFPPWQGPDFIWRRNVGWCLARHCSTGKEVDHDHAQERTAAGTGRKLTSGTPLPSTGAGADQCEAVQHRSGGRTLRRDGQDDPLLRVHGLAALGGPHRGGLPAVRGQRSSHAALH